MRFLLGWRHDLNKTEKGVQSCASYAAKHVDVQINLVLKPIQERVEEKKPIPSVRLLYKSCAFQFTIYSLIYGKLFIMQGDILNSLNCIYNS